MRKFYSFLSVLCAMVLSLVLSGCGCDSDNDTGLAKHIILFIGDGMQLHHEIAASRYLTGIDSGLVFHDWDTEGGYKGYVSAWDVTTYNLYANDALEPEYNGVNVPANDPCLGYDPNKGGSAPNPLVAVPDENYFLTILSLPSRTKVPSTDSAAAGTAISTGIKTAEGNINWYMDDLPGGELETITEKVRSQLGYAVGIVSTVQFNHATPACFAAHNVSRTNYLEIAAEIIRTSQPDVVIGGGHKDWYTGSINDTLYNEIKNSAEYVFVERVTGQNGGNNLLNAANQAIAGNKKLFGLFGGAGGNFESPVPIDSPGYPFVNPGSTENPSLADAVKAALKVLSKDPDGFFVMFEQGDIDWANHGRDFARMVGCMYDLNEAVKAAEEFVDIPGDDITWSNTLVIVTADHANSYMRNLAMLGNGDLPEQNGPSSGSNYANVDYPGGEIWYGQTVQDDSHGGHTNELVMIYARGAGSNLFMQYESMWYPGTRIIDNTHVFEVMKAAAGVR